MIHLHTLGDALITIGEREIRPTSPMVFAALLYLSMERGRRVPRAALQELLFPDVDERSGAHSLRQLLYKLRQLGAPLEADSSAVLIKSDQVRDDAATEVSFSDGPSDSLRKYSFGFLPDYTPGFSPRFEDWLEQRRNSIGGNIRRQLVAAICLNRDASNWRSVERLSRALLGLDPLNEEATLALAEATALTGAKAQALDILSRYENETGRADLRLPPAILRRRISESFPNGARRRTAPFVGRSADAESLRQLTRRARSGVASLAVITGEAGIGKTRLVEEIADLASLEGMRVHVVRCQSHYASRPLGVFIELVPHLLSCRGALGASPQSLSHLNLLISHRDDQQDRPVDARDDTTRSAILLAALRDLVDAVASETPLFLVVEDAHNADRDSLRELSGLAQTNTHRSMMVVFTTRYLEPLKRASVIHDSALVRKLKPLEQEAMEDLVQHLLPSEPPDDDVAGWCVRTASGNPLFLQMLCARYTETGEPFTVPPDLISAITRRIELLPRDCAEILEICALLGRHTTIEALLTLTDLAPLELLPAIRRLEEEGYLQAQDGTVRISHDLLIECTLSLIPPVARKLLHTCVAAHLEARFNQSKDAALLWDCAEQWALSGETAKAIQLLRECARHAAMIGRASHALELLTRARELAKNPGDAAAVLVDMMFAAKSAGLWPRVLELSESLRHMQPEETQPGGHTPQELLAIEATWAVRLQRSCVERLLSCVNNTLASSGHRLDAALLHLKVAHENGEERLAGNAFAAVQSLLDPHSKSYSNRIIPVIYHTTFGDQNHALQLTRMLRKELGLMQSLNDELRAASNVGMALEFLGEVQECCDVSREYYDKTRVLGLAVWQIEFCSNICGANAIVERFEELETWFLKLETTVVRPMSALISRTVHSHGFELALWKRDVDRAKERLSALAATSVGDTLRGTSYVSAGEIRILQINPTFRCTADQIKRLQSLYLESRNLYSADALVLALGEALRREGRQNQTVDLIDDYVRTWRRERTPLVPSLQHLRQACARNSSPLAQ